MKEKEKNANGTWDAFIVYYLEGKKLKAHYYNRPMCYAQYKYFSVMNRNGTTFTVNYEDIILLIIDHKVLVDNSKRKEKR
jgi:hypothetical protein